MFRLDAVIKSVVTGKPSLAGGRGRCVGCIIFFVEVGGEVKGEGGLGFAGAVAEGGGLSVDGLHYVLEESVTGEVWVVRDVSFFLAVTSVVESVVDALLLQVEGAKTWKDNLVSFCYLTGDFDVEVFEDGTDR